MRHGFCAARSVDSATHIPASARTTPWMYFRRCIPPPRRNYALLGAGHAAVGIGGVAKAVAEEVEGENDDEHRDDREHEPGVERDDIDVLRLVQQYAPARDGGS